jgi:hypothetical protein
MANDHRNYPAARKQLISFLQTEGFKAQPSEVYRPASKHCWVDVAALRGQDYRAFEYKSRTDSIRRGLEQCCSYAGAFNYVVQVADRYRVTSSPYFYHFKSRGFGVWLHDGAKFYVLLPPKRQPIRRQAKVVVERQFRHLVTSLDKDETVPILKWC